MATKLRVVFVGPSPSVQGGMSRVMTKIKTHLPETVNCRTVATFTRYTGAAGTHVSDRGSSFVQALVFCKAFTQIVFYAFCPRTVFHVHFSVRGSLLRKGMICTVLQMLRCRYVVHAHAPDTDWFHPWLPEPAKGLVLWGIGGAAKFIVLTRFWSDYYASMFQLPLTQLLVLPTPADAPASIPHRAANLSMNLLFVGRVGLRKGTFDAIRAFAQLPEDVREKCHLTLAGDGDVDLAEKLAAELGCSHQIDILGWVETAEVERLMAKADVLLLPSHAEGLATALVEGMSWGLAVITTDVGGAGEFVKSGRNGILVRPGDIEGISDAICKLARDPKMRLRLGDAARETMSGFGIERYVTTLCRMYEDLVCCPRTSIAKYNECC